MGHGRGEFTDRNQTARGQELAFQFLRLVAQMLFTLPQCRFRS